MICRSPQMIFDEVVVAVDHLLGGDAFLAGTDGDRHAVLVASADEEHFLLFQAQIAHIDVSRHVNASQVSYMYTSVGIG